MAFTKKLWKDNKAGGTPLDATGLNDLEDRIDAGIAAVPSGPGGSALPTMVPLGNVTGALTLTLTDTPKHARGVLIGDAVITVDGLAAGRSAKFFLVQDSVGGHSVTINNRTPVVPSAPLEPMTVFFETDGTEVNLVVPGEEPATAGGTAAVAPNTLITPAVSGLSNDPLAAGQKTGLWLRRTQVRQPRGTLVKAINTAAMLSSGTAGVTQDASPDHPAGAILVTASGFTKRTPTWAFNSTLDLTNKTLWVNTKVTAQLSGVDNPTNMYRLRLEVSSDGFAGTGSDGNSGANRSFVTMIPQNGQYQVYNIWQPFSVSSADWSTIGTGADFSAITHGRFYLENNSGAQVTTLAASALYTTPQEPRAKVCLSFDDQYLAGTDQQWTTMLPKMIAKGFVGTLYLNVAQASTAEVEKARAMQRLGWQIASHAWTNAEHVNLAGDALVDSLMRSRHRHRQLGFWGGEDWAWWGGLSGSAANHDIMRTYFRSGRLFLSNPVTTETLPVGNPMRIRCWGMGTPDTTDVGAGMISYIGKAIAGRGAAFLTWHNSGFGAEFDAVLNYLETQVAAGACDVVTTHDCLAPWVVDA